MYWFSIYGQCILVIHFFDFPDPDRLCDSVIHSYVLSDLNQEHLVLSILPSFVALEMIADMSTLGDELSTQEFHKIYIHQYKDVRYIYTLAQTTTHTCTNTHTQ